MHVFTFEEEQGFQQSAFFRSALSSHTQPEHNSISHTAIDGSTSTGSKSNKRETKWVQKKPKLNKRIRRGWGKNGKSVSFSIFSSNANGLKGKLESLKNNINQFQPSCIMVQESKLRNKGSIKLNGYQTFELNRNGMGGGLFTAIEESLCPVLIRSGQDNTEILVTQISLAGLNIRLINGYGPQEDSS